MTKAKNLSCPSVGVAGDLDVAELSRFRLRLRPAGRVATREVSLRSTISHASLKASLLNGISLSLRALSCFSRNLTEPNQFIHAETISLTSLTSRRSIAVFLGAVVATVIKRPNLTADTSAGSLTW